MMANRILAFSLRALVESSAEFAQTTVESPAGLAALSAQIFKTLESSASEIENADIEKGESCVHHAIRPLSRLALRNTGRRRVSRTRARAPAQISVSWLVARRRSPLARSGGLRCRRG